MDNKDKIIDKNKELLDLVKSYHDYYGTYHHHKEIMAYSATGLFLTGCSYICFNKNTYAYPISIILIIFILGILLIFFIVWQLRQRLFAANMVSACINLISKILTNNWNVLDLNPKKLNLNNTLDYFPSELAKGNP
ncbi:MAG: hypothetical protein ACMUIU_14975 [bacterium]